MEKTDQLQCASFKAYQAGQRRLLEKGDYADVTLICRDGKTTFRAHKAILSTHSEFFSKAFQPGKFIEGCTGEVKLEIGDPDVMSQMLKYLYTLEYDDFASPSEACWMHAKLYAAADFYMIPALKKASCARFEQSANTLCTSPDSKAFEKLFAVVLFADENSHNEKSCSLLQTAAKVVLSNHRHFVQLRNGIGLEWVRKTMDNSMAFGKEFGVASFKKWQKFEKIKCPECDSVWAVERPRTNLHCPFCGHEKLGWDDYRVV